MSAKHLGLAPGLQLPLEAATETFGILAVRGAGKTNTARVMAEEMFAAGIPFCACDPVGSWWGLRAGRNGAGDGLPIPIFGGRHGDVPIEKGGGALIADLLVDQRVSCVIDLSEFEHEAPKKQFLLDFARRLYHRNTAPLHLFLEEADDYIPQVLRGDKSEKGVEPQLLRAMENLVRRGRARGLGVTLITQRSASINKSVLTQIGTLIAMRTTSPQDRAAVEAWVKYHGQKQELLASLSGLQNGEAWVWSPEFLGSTTRVRFRLSHTFDSGATPRHDMGGKSVKSPATLAEINLGEIRERMAATIERAKAEDPKALRAEIAALRRQLAERPAPVAPPAPAVETVEVPALSADQVAALEATVERLEAATREARDAAERATELGGGILAGLLAVRNGRQVAQVAAAGRAAAATAAASRRAPAPVKATKGAAAAGSRAAPTRPQQKILDSLAALEGIGIAQPTRTQLALWCEVSSTSGGYFNNLGALRTADLLTYPVSGRVSLTVEGRSLADGGAAMSVDELHDSLYARLPAPQAAIIRELIAIHPEAISKDELADRVGVSRTSGGYFNNLGSLRTLGLIDYPQPGRAVALPVLFLEAT